MAVITTTTRVCDTHEAACKEADKVTEYEFRDPDTGVPQTIDLCPSERKKRDAAKAALTSGARENESRVQQATRQHEEGLIALYQEGYTDGVRKKKFGTRYPVPGSITVSPNGHTAPPPEGDWGPLERASKAWHSAMIGPPRGQWKPQGVVTEKFFQSPIGAVWKGWAAGDPVPALWEGWETGKPLPMPS